MDDSDYGQQQHHEDASTAQKTADLTAFVQNLLLQMHTRFQAMSDSIITKIDEMGSRIDDLERSVAELVQETGLGDAMPQASYHHLRAASTKCSEMVIVVSGGQVDIPELVRESFIV